MNELNADSDVKPANEDVNEKKPDTEESKSAAEDAKVIARQRSKDDLARKRRELRKGRGKR